MKQKNVKPIYKIKIFTKPKEDYSCELSDERK